MMVAENILRSGLEHYGLDVTFQNVNKQKINFEDRNRYRLWELPFLCDYIVNNHHTYVEASMPSIRGHLKKAVWNHGECNPELREVARIFFSLSETLPRHMSNERSILFPLIAELDNAYKTNGKLEEDKVGLVSKLIAEMTSEHAVAQDAMTQIRRLLNDYKIIPETSGLPTTYAALIEFERDLHRQTFIENEVLFPAAQKMERELQILNG
jgi:regulator of cell morphogenesis and NO signaling